MPSTPAMTSRLPSQDRRVSDIGAPSSVVTPGTDIVMCLSCHMAHASPYPHMLRWDYSEMITGNGEAVSGKGCFVCHSSKGSI
jgi:hypothetical protein